MTDEDPDEAEATDGAAIGPSDLDDVDVDPEEFGPDMTLDEMMDEMERMAEADEDPMRTDEIVATTVEMWAAAEFADRADHVEVDERLAKGLEMSMGTLPLLYVAAGDPDEEEFESRANALDEAVGNVETAAMEHARRANQREDVEPADLEEVMKGTAESDDLDALMKDVADELDDLPEVDVSVYEAFLDVVGGFEDVREAYEEAVDGEEQESERTR